MKKKLRYCGTTVFHVFPVSTERSHAYDDDSSSHLVLLRDTPTASQSSASSGRHGAAEQANEVRC